MLYGSRYERQKECVREIKDNGCEMEIDLGDKETEQQLVEAQQRKIKHKEMHCFG
jgi:hypothetical protein